MLTRIQLRTTVQTKVRCYSSLNGFPNGVLRKLYLNTGLYNQFWFYFQICSALINSNMKASLSRYKLNWFFEKVEKYRRSRRQHITNPSNSLFPFSCSLKRPPVSSFISWMKFHISVSTLWSSKSPKDECCNAGVRSRGSCGEEPQRWLP